MQQPPNQQPPNQQPYTNYQQQPPQFAPQGQYGGFSGQPAPMPPPKKKSRLGLILGIIAGVCILGCIGTFVIMASAAKSISSGTVSNSNGTSSSSSSTSTGKWTTTHTFSGNGGKKTATFSAPADWKIVWKCDHSSFQGLDYNMIIVVYNSDGTISDTGVNATCKANYTHDETEIHTSGNVYLDVNSEGSWNIQVQEMK